MLRAALDKSASPVAVTPSASVFSTFELDALRFIEGGRNVYGTDTAACLRKIDARFPGLIVFSEGRREAAMIRSKANFFAELTEAGRKVVQS
jgi:hypothetical protein